MRITLTSVLVDDQAKALDFYTVSSGFQKKTTCRWASSPGSPSVSPDAPDGVELLLEPDQHPAARPFKEALVADGIPFTAFTVDDVEAEHARLSELGCGVHPAPDVDGPGHHGGVRRHLRQPDPDPVARGGVTPLTPTPLGY